MYRTLSLFSGVGGWELGCQLAGVDRIFTVAQFVELAQYPRKVLGSRFPGVPIWDDVRTFNPEPGSFECIVASPPCQSFSQAGARKAGDDKRDMFPEFFRLLRRVRPRWALVENVPGLLTINAGRYFRGILWQFAQAGYDVEWQVISCAQVGGVHKRERVWIIAYSRCPHGMSQQCQAELEREKQVRDATFGERVFSPQSWRSSSSARLLANTQSTGWGTSRSSSPQEGTDSALVGGGAKSPNPNSEGLEGWEQEPSGALSLHEFERPHGSSDGQQKTFSKFCGENDGFSSELDGIRGIDYLMRHSDLPEWLPKAINTDSIPYRKERLQALGNAVVPNVASIVWRRLATIVGDEIDENAS